MRAGVMTWARAALLATALVPAVMAVPASAEEATIYRDKMGVPHVYGDTAPAIYYGAAYAIAQDRMAEGEIYMRGALGRMAEIMGKDLVEADKQARLRTLTAAEVKAQFEALTPEYQAILRAMHEGWNAYVREVRGDPAKVPYEYKDWGILPTEWTLWEFLDVMGGLQRGYGSGGGGHELTNLAFYRDLEKKLGAEKARIIFDDVVPLDDPDAVPIVPDGERRSVLASADAAVQAMQMAQPMTAATAAEVAANGDARRFGRDMMGMSRGASRLFMVGASKSADGKPIMLHATADGPDVHISGAGFNVAGFVLPPMCPIIMGRTDSNGFTFTTGESDLIDIYAEKLNPANRRQYWHNGAWRDMTVRQEVIKVKGAAPVTVDIERTVHGPVISREDGAETAYTEKNAISGYELAGLAGMIELNRATDLQSYKKAAQAITFNFNINYAGTDGHIALYHSGRLPVRAKGVDPRLPTPGTGEYEWQGMLSPEQHVFVVDPAQGFIHAWNNKVTTDSRYGDTSRYGKSNRAWMGVEFAKSKDKLSVADVHEAHRRMGGSAGGVDLTVTNPKFFTPYLKAAVAGDTRLEAVVAAMDGWNAIYEDLDKDGYYDSIGLTIYREWIDTAQKNIIGDDIGDWWHKIDDENYIKYRTDVVLRAIEGSDAGLPMKHDWFNGMNRNQVLRQTVADAADILAKRYDSADPSRWRQPIFYKYYDAAAVEKNPDKPPFRGEPRGSTAGKLGLQPAYVPANLSESWNMLIKLTPEDTNLYDSTPTGGQNMFIGPDGKGNPNIADQVTLHVNYQFKAVTLNRDKVVKDAVSIQKVTLPAAINHTK